MATYIPIFHIPRFYKREIYIERKDSTNQQPQRHPIQFISYSIVPQIYNTTIHRNLKHQKHRKVIGVIHTAAFPPALRILCPAAAAKGWVHATIPVVLCTALLRLGKVMNWGSEEDIFVYLSLSLFFIEA